MTVRIAVVLAAGVALAGCAPPLLRRAREGDAAAVKALLARGDDPDVRGGYRNGETPLMIAAGRGTLSVVEALVEKGAKVNVAGYRGETALMRAADHGRVDIVRYLIGHGADVTAKGEQGTTALHYATASGDVETVRSLLEHGADINADDRMYVGRTPLGIAAYFGEADIAGLLLERGADPRKPGNNGRSPADQAAWQGHFALSKMFKRAEEGKLPDSPPSSVGPGPVSDVDTPAYHYPENPSAFAVVVGAGSYLGLPVAAFAERDAKAVREHLKALGFPEDHILWLSGVQATRAGLVKALEGRLSGLVDERSTVLFYFAGRGAADSKTGQAYLLPMDGDPDYLADTGYPVHRLYEKLSELRAAQAFAILDCGFSGRGDRSALPAGAFPADRTDETTLGPGKVIAMLPAQSGEATKPLSAQGHGALTYFLLRGLNEAARNLEGSITVGSLYDYMRANAQAPQLIPESSSQTVRFKLR